MSSGVGQFCLCHLIVGSKIPVRTRVVDALALVTLPRNRRFLCTRCCSMSCIFCIILSLQPLSEGGTVITCVLQKKEQRQVEV